MDRILNWVIFGPVVFLSAWGALLMWSDYQTYRNVRRSELERCLHHADYGEPPCDGTQWIGK